jgi:type I restriction enzyme R subunit
MKANLPSAAVQAIVGAMETHRTLATRLLSDEGSRGAFLDVIYELLRRGSSDGLFVGATDR